MMNKKVKKNNKNKKVYHGEGGFILAAILSNLEKAKNFVQENAEAAVDAVSDLNPFKSNISNVIEELGKTNLSDNDVEILREIKERILNDDKYDKKAIEKEIKEIEKIVKKNVYDKYAEKLNTEIIKRKNLPPPPEGTSTDKGETLITKEHVPLFNMRRKSQQNTRRVLFSHPPLPQNDSNKRLDYLECYIKMLDLKLKIVDEEIVDESEINGIKTGVCETYIDDEFIKEMKNKSANNRLKNILKWFSLICPLIGSINQLSLTSLLGQSGGIKITTDNAGKAIEKSKEYFEDISAFINGYVASGLSVIENVSATGEFIDSGIDLGLLPENLVSRISTADANSSFKDAVSILAIKSKSLSSLAFIKSYEILSKTFCMLMFNFFLFTSVLGDTNDGVQDYLSEIIFSTIDTNLITGGGKKGKRTKDPVKALLEFNNKTLRDILNPAKTKTKSARKPRKAAAEPAKKKK